MSQLETLVERATQSELFTAPRLAADLERFLRDHGPRMRELAGEAFGARRADRLLRRQRRLVVVDVLGQVPVRPADDARLGRAAELRARVADAAPARPRLDRLRRVVLGRDRGHARGAPPREGGGRPHRRARALGRLRDRPRGRRVHRLRRARAVRAADGRRHAVRARVGAARGQRRGRRDRRRHPAPARADRRLVRLRQGARRGARPRVPAGPGPVLRRQRAALRARLQVRADRLHGEHPHARLGDRERRVPPRAGRDARAPAARDGVPARHRRVARR